VGVQILILSVILGLFLYNSHLWLA